MAETVDVAHNKEPIHVVLGRPHQFADVGKQAKDLLYKGFSSGNMLMMSCVMPGGALLSTTATMFDGNVVGLMSTSFKSAGVQTELSGGTLNQITASSTYEDLAPGLKIALATALPGAEDIGKAQVQYQLNNAAFDATMIGLKSTPTLQFSANLGSERLSLGASALYNSETKEVSTLNTGIGYLRPDMSAAFFYDPLKDNAMDAYFTRHISPRAMLGGHLHFKVDKQVTAATLGGSLRMDAQSTIKAKWNNQGVLGALFEHQPNPFLTVGMYVDVDTFNLRRQPNVGFCVSVLGSVA
ncbi:voltage-dependent anion channel protein 2 [Marchantia polymorpha subsp. ruderalis]|uniref:Uncharacterized protein n=2 Tax=Marchantia polymorpha TaxID=3197 RepID=A0A176VRT1_MARPO|nr:hypothetical protein AXG93_1660s1560 [Marchantia polymorpha subsp. ruderalis]PTQ39341.1 hypothetical protein MARPO_0045s0018 [Marchantia polymorpha]BBN15548.1 hypothetical protein Mp_6g20460 [Marchantia polymorpha subsp. ruderalis]|eukprot:PTQ39341.1 hypothetical protein MARPO_0045s0018 [Marchantia polymorpha]